jgi:hypothetical protein
LSARRLIVAIQQLPNESATSRALNDGCIPWGNEANLLADLWALKANEGREKGQLVDHPTRAQKVAKARTAVKRAEVVELRARFEKRKKAYGLG